MYCMAYVERNSRAEFLDEIGGFPRFRVEHFGSIDGALARAKELLGNQGVRSMEIYSLSGAVIFDENQIASLRNEPLAGPPEIRGT